MILFMNKNTTFGEMAIDKGTKSELIREKLVRDLKLFHRRYSVRQTDDQRIVITTKL